MLYVVMCSCMLWSVVTCYEVLLHAVQCCYMLPSVINFVQCCYMLPSVITCCAVLLHATNVLLHDVQRC